MRAAKVLRKGGLLAHQTGTVAGVAASPLMRTAIKKIQGFKQRQGPFLLLADSRSRALKQARYISPALRKIAKQSWPGAVTLVFSARSNMPSCAYQKGRMAVRVDSDVETRRLAKLCGGLLLSSSLNRRGKATLPLKHSILWRNSAYLSAYVRAKGVIASGQVSTIYRFIGSKVSCLR